MTPGIKQYINGVFITRTLVLSCSDFFCTLYGRFNCWQMESSHCESNMELKHQASLFCCFFLFKVSCITEFEITVPRGPVTGFYGEALILPCTFPVDSWDLNSTVIIWQRGLDVVHCFYYSRDQLDRQNPHYLKRTSLFIQEMATGNASLKLDRVTLLDAGVYTCYISTNTGSQKKSFKVNNIAAFYSEPRLQFSMLTDGLNLLVTSDGGYPSPKLQWLMENSDITNQTQTHFMQDTQTGLYIVSSWINLKEVTKSSLTFIMHNKPLGQDIRREIQLYSDKSRIGQSAYRCHGCSILISVILLLIVMGLLFVFITRRRTERTKQNDGLKSQISASSLASMRHNVV
ncbi:hypothetical protein PO909_019629 [Leuciscus waleckii]